VKGKIHKKERNPELVFGLVPKKKIQQKSSPFVLSTKKTLVAKTNVGHTPRIKTTPGTTGAWIKKITTSGGERIFKGGGGKTGALLGLLVNQGVFCGFIGGGEKGLAPAKNPPPPIGILQGHQKKKR